MDIKKEYLLFFGFFIVILFFNAIKNRYNGNNCVPESCEKNKSINKSSDYEFVGGNNNKSDIQSNTYPNNYFQNEKEIDDYMNCLDCVSEKNKDIDNENNCPSCVNKCPEVLKNSGKLIVEISELLKNCKKEEKIAEEIIKDNLKNIKNCIKQDLKYKQIAKNYDEAIRILSENIEVCEKNTDIKKSDLKMERNLADLIDEIY